MKLPSRNHSHHRTNYHRPLQNRLKSQIISTTNQPQKSLISKRPLAIIDIWVTYYAYLYISWRSVDLLQSTKSTLQNSSDDEFAIDYYWIELNIELFILVSKYHLRFQEGVATMWVYPCWQYVFSEFFFFIFLDLNKFRDGKWYFFVCML